jgi:hypothetical protein
MPERSPSDTPPLSTGDGGRADMPILPFQDLWHTFPAQRLDAGIARGLERSVRVSASKQEGATLRAFHDEYRAHR